MTSTARSSESEWRAALADITPAMVAGMPFAMLCGALAVAKGLSPAEVLTMSLVVFAGGAQFAAIQMWSYPVPVAALVISTALINSRHILMGVSVRPKLAALSAPQRMLGCFTLGFTFAGVIVPAQTLMQKETPHALMGRISSTMMSVIFFAQLLGLVLSGFLAQAFGVRAVFFLCAVLAWVLTGAGRLLLNTDRHAAAL